MILATQTVDDFASADLLRTVVESCPTKLLLANPALDRRQYAELFQLNEMELDLLTGLDPASADSAQASGPDQGPHSDGRSEELLDLHQHAHRQRRVAAMFREYGFEAGLDRLAASPDSGRCCHVAS